ncbi:MAG: efflux RND transporter periplasmic adaptor subunit [Planctomycetaceae bacterium]
MIAIAGILAAVGYGFLPKPVLVDTARVTRGSLAVTVSEDGKTRVRDRYLISSPLAGRLHRIKVRAGDPVTAPPSLESSGNGNGVAATALEDPINGHGLDPIPPTISPGATAVTDLAIIDPIDPSLLDSRQIAQAELHVKAMQTAIQSAAASREKANVALEWAKTDLERRKGLAGKGANSKQELEDAAMLVRSRIEELNVAKFAEVTAQYERDLASAALLRSQPLAPDTAEKWQLRLQSPITGVVMKVLQESEAIVQQGTPLLEVGDPRDLEVDIEVLSTDAVRIRPGQTVRLKHWGGERPLTARVRLVEPSGFLKLSALGVEEQRVHVIANFEDPYSARPTLGNGYRVEAEIVLWEQDGVVKIPTGALFRENGSATPSAPAQPPRDLWAVYVVENGVARKRQVEIGRRNGLEAEVLNGLTESDQVIVHPSDRIRDQVQVQPR